MSYMDSLLRVVDSVKDQAKDAVWALNGCICKPQATIKVNGRTYRIVKALGEGGFSFVYLAQDDVTGREFALKKIRVHNSEGVKAAMREVESYRRFKHPNIIRIYDSATVQDPTGEGKIVYLFLPLYKRGNLQDAINLHSINGTHFSEKEMVTLFKGTCEAVRAMHDYHALVPVDGPRPRTSHQSSRSSTSTIRPDTYSSQGKMMVSGGYSQPLPEDDEEPDDDHSFPEPEGDAEGGFSYGGSSVPLVPPKHKNKGRSKTSPAFGGDEELERLNAESAAYEDGTVSAPTANGPAPPGMKREHVPYAHRDIKPGNIMLSDEGNPILMDFGSAVVARIPIRNRSEALTQQDIAAEQSTMTYRAPELFDVKTGATLDEKVDIWSLGCTLYALAYNRSPFETAEAAGGSIAMAAMNGQYRHVAPAANAYSQGFRSLIDACMVVDPAERPDIHRVLELTEGVLRTLG